MRMSDRQLIAASREAVWAALQDPEVLRRSIPGCESIEKIDERHLVANVIAKVGPVKARFNGTIRLSEMDPPNGCRISGEGKSGSAGFASGAATVALTPDGDGTLVTYDVEATVGGKLAQIGSRVVDAAATKMADDFFAEFGRIVSRAPTTDLGPEMAAAAAYQGLSPMVWVPTLVVMMAFFVLLFA